MRCNRKFMHGKRMRRSPIRKDTPVIDVTKGDVDTSLADIVYTKEKVDEELRKSGHHTEEAIRGKKVSEKHRVGTETSGGKVFEGTAAFEL